MIDNYKNKLKSMLSEKRYKHSLGVCDEAVKLAEKYGADTEKAYKAGILHDCAKGCLLYTSPSPRDLSTSRMPSSA